RALRRRSRRVRQAAGAAQAPRPAPCARQVREGGRQEAAGARGARQGDATDGEASAHSAARAQARGRRLLGPDLAVAAVRPALTLRPVGANLAVSFVFSPKGRGDAAMALSAPVGGSGNSGTGEV